MPKPDMRLEDRAAIGDLMARYARAVDRREWEAVRATYFPDAYDDHGEFKGGTDEFITWVSRRHEKVVQSMHFLGNCLIEFTGDDVAFVETYFIARQTYSADAAAARTMVGTDDPVPMEAEIWGRYIDVMERRAGEWRTARRTVAFEVLQAHRQTSLPLASSWALARRDADDPSYTMRRLALERARKKTG